MASILVYGSREFGRVVKELVSCCGHDFAGFIDDYHPGEEVLGRFDDVSRRFPPPAHEVAIAVGYKDLAARWGVFEAVKERGYRVPPLVHPRAYVADSATVDEGAIVMAGAIVDVRVVLAPLVVAWPGVVVNHDSVVQANSFLSPAVTVCGGATIGRQSFVGAGATIVDHVSVPPDSFIRAQSLVTGRENRTRRDSGP